MPERSIRAFSVLWQNSSPNEISPIGALVYWYLPNSVMNVVRSLDPSESVICHYSFVASKSAKHLAFFSIDATISLGEGNGCVGRLTNLFNWTRSTTDCTFPFGFFTNYITEHQSVSPVTFLKITFLFSSSNFSFAEIWNAYAVLLGLHTCNGFIVFHLSHYCIVPSLWSMVLFKIPTCPSYRRLSGQSRGLIVFIRYLT